MVTNVTRISPTDTGDHARLIVKIYADHIARNVNVFHLQNNMIFPNFFASLTHRHPRGKYHVVNLIE